MVGDCLCWKFISKLFICCYQVMKAYREVEHERDKLKVNFAIFMATLHSYKSLMTGRWFVAFVHAVEGCARPDEWIDNCQFRLLGWCGWLEWDPAISAHRSGQQVASLLQQLTDKRAKVCQINGEVWILIPSGLLLYWLVDKKWWLSCERAIWPMWVMCWLNWM